MIRIKGRNGPFTFHHHYAEVMDCAGAEPPAPLAYVEIFSNSPHTRSAPVTFSGPPREVVKLLRKIARELETATRANSGANVKTKKEGKA